MGQERERVKPESGTSGRKGRSHDVVTTRIGSHSRSRSRDRGRRSHRSRSGERDHGRRNLLDMCMNYQPRRLRMNRQEEPEPNKCLGVFGLNLRTTEKDLRGIFSRFGSIEKCTLVLNGQTGRSRGFSFISFDSLRDAKAAKEACNGIEIEGSRVRVDFSITQRAHTPTPGVYMGKPRYDSRDYGSRSNYHDRERRRHDYHRKSGYRRSLSPPPLPIRRHPRRSHSRSRSRSHRKHH